MSDLHPENSLLTRWREVLQRRSPETAIFTPDGAVLRTFADIETEAGELMEPLAETPHGTVAGVQVGNHPSWPALLLALFRQGCVPLPLGRHIERAELDAALTLVGAGALLSINTQGELAITRRGDSPSPGCEFLKLTSGTTSAARAIRFQSHQLVADCDQICITMGITEADVNFGVIPFSHSYGFSNLVTPLLCRGVPLVASEDRLPRAILNGLAQSGATVFPGMPVFFEKMTALEDGPALPRLRLCISAGAPLSPRVAEAFANRFGCKIHVFYGSSECGGIAYDASDAHDLPAGYVGTPMHGVSVTREGEGEGAFRISVRSGAVGDGYYPVAEENVLGAGRFIPSDLVEFNGDAMILVGRASDVINIAGRKLNPLEVEERVASFAGVRQVVVFGIPSRLRGEEPVLCVAGEDLDRAALLSFCRQSLSEWQLPRDVWVVPEIATNERGKISRRLLAERYLAART